MFIHEIWGRRFTREISKFQKSELGKFSPNFPLKHLITSTNSTFFRIKGKAYYLVFS